jgi:Aromatic-ring-opening dioxygenase LigAB, LigA subunit
MSRYDVNVVLYRLKKDAAFRARFQTDARAALTAADLTEEERDAFVRWDARRLNELGGSLHLLVSIPAGISNGGPRPPPMPPDRSQPPRRSRGGAR